MGGLSEAGSRKGGNSHGERGKVVYDNTDEVAYLKLPGNSELTDRELSDVVGGDLIEYTSGMNSQAIYDVIDWMVKLIV